jgi:acetylornithine deacetylase/succinyl-diaminopimelate desuccinylase-like protein
MASSLFGRGEMEMREYGDASVVELTRALVRVPSYLGEGVNEIEVAEMLSALLEQIPGLTVTRQPVGSEGRFNVLASSGGEARELLIASHQDTVLPSAGWTRDPLEGALEGSRLYGLGAYDTKGGSAALLTALRMMGDMSQWPGLRLLFYCGEESDMDGMRTFVEASDEPPGQLAVMVEPSELRILERLRGLIELRVTVHGKTAHAAQSQSGLGASAILALTEALHELGEWLARPEFTDPVLGASTLNVARFDGGLYVGEDGARKVQLAAQANAVADYAWTLLELRPATPQLGGALLQGHIEELVAAQGQDLWAEVEVVHDYGVLSTDRAQLGTLEAIVRACTGAENPYCSPQGLGFSDAQFLQEKFGTLVVDLGPSGQGMHAADEYVDVDSLETLVQVYPRIIAAYCS